MQKHSRLYKTSNIVTKKEVHSDFNDYQKNAIRDLNTEKNNSYPWNLKFA